MSSSSAKTKSLEKKTVSGKAGGVKAYQKQRLKGCRIYDDDDDDDDDSIIPQDLRTIMAWLGKPPWKEDPSGKIHKNKNQPMIAACFRLLFTIVGISWINAYPESDYPFSLSDISRIGWTTDTKYHSTIYSPNKWSPFTWYFLSKKNSPQKPPWNFPSKMGHQPPR